MLPNLNSDFRNSDLQQNAVYIYDDNNNGIFNSEDYLLFFGQSPHEWAFDSIQNIFDYSGECGGSLITDECGVCGGDGCRDGL